MAACLAMRTLAERIRHLEQDTNDAGPAALSDHTRSRARTQGCPGHRPDNAAALLIASRDNPQRLRSEAAFPEHCAASPRREPSGQMRAVSHSSKSAALGSGQQAYVERITAEGKIMRCLKRFITREVYRLLQAKTLSSAAMGARNRGQDTQHLDQAGNPLWYVAQPA